jgi:hypothetical protein
MRALARRAAVAATLSLIWTGCSGGSPLGGELGEPVPLGLTFHYDPAVQGQPFLTEIAQSEDYDCYFSGTTVFTRTPPSIAVDGSGADCRSPNMLYTLGFGGEDNEHTIFVVVKPTQSGMVNSYVFDRLKNRADIIYGYVAGNFEYFVEENGFTGDSPRTGTAIPASVNQWQTIAYSVGADGSNKEQRGYRNGVLEVGPLTKNFTITPLNGGITLGNSAPGYNPFRGQIGHVFWWDRQLSDGEIETVHAWVRDQGGFSGFLP